MLDVMKTYLAPLLLVLALIVPASGVAQTLPCTPCIGLVTDAPDRVAEALDTAPAIPEDALLLVGWRVDLSAAGSTDASSVASRAERLDALGATALPSLVFHAPAPLESNLGALGRELESAAAGVRGAPKDAWFQIAWEPSTPPSDATRAAEVAFFIKRAAVAVTGARGSGDGRVVSPPLPADPEFLEALYAQEVAAYLDAVALEPAAPEALEASLEALTRLDPGKPVMLDALPIPELPARALTQAARWASTGVSVTLFGPADALQIEELASPMVSMAREFSGDVSFDPYSSPSGRDGSRAWSFVRGEDLGLRIVADVSETQQETGELVLDFSDRSLQRPARVPLDGRDPIPLAGVRRTDAGLELRVADPGPVALLRFERPSMEELVGEGGVAEEVTIASERQIPVEEILRRLQAFEDAQARAVDHWQAINETHLRFQFGTGTQTFEATLKGPFFFREGEVADWAWETFYVNGVQWRGDRIPEIPLVEPEKAATLPVEITFDKTYSYRLRGTETIDGRDTWVVEFEPVDESEAEAQRLFRGTVWIDREIYARVRTRGVQIGLTGEVLSNEETLHYTPVDADGRPTDWSGDHFVLPLNTVSRQLLSILNGTTLVERETDFTELVLNGPEFEENRDRVAESDLTMVRDTAEGLRYLVMDEETGERVIQEGFDRDRVFVAGGVFHDESFDFPLPVAGVNYFSFDYRDTGTQVNALFGGALLSISAADPDFLGSKWDAGFDAFAIAFAGSDQVFRNEQEIPGEEVEIRPASLDLKLGYPLGPFLKLRGQYEIDFVSYGRADDTDPDFILPEDHFTQQLSLFGRFSRNGYQLDLGGSYNVRSDWEPWGLPGSPGFVADAEPFEDYLQWSVSASKNWYLPNFRKIGLEIDYVDGQDLDRFSKYGFGRFGDTRVHGFQSDKVRAERAYLLHASYGFELNELLRLDGIVDVASATDEAAGLDNELLVGLGVQGTFVGPWQTVVNIDLGVPVEGPDDGFTAWLVFLKLVEWDWLERWLE